MKRLFQIGSGLVWLIASAHTPAVTLDALLQRTIDHNPTILEAKQNLERATGRRLIFHAVAYPNAAIGVAAGDQGGHRSGSSSNTPFGFAYGGFIQPIFNAAIPASFRRGDVEVLIAQQRLNVAVVDQLHAARVAFYTALYNRSLDQVRSSQRQRFAQNATSQKGRYEQGLADRSAYVSAELQTRELDPLVGTAQRAYGGAILQMAEAMGQDLGPDAKLPEPEGNLTYAPVEIELEPEVAGALQRRPDLALARLLVRAANEEQRIIEAEYYPSVNAIVAGYYIPVSGIRREATGSPRRSDDVISSEVLAGGAYTWRVIDSRTYGAAKSARATREINELLLQKMEKDVPREMARLQQNFQAIAAQEKSLATAGRAAEENVATVQQNLEGGIVSQYEARVTENASLDAKSALLTLAWQQNLARAEWDRATGRYFQFSEAAPSSYSSSR